MLAGNAAYFPEFESDDFLEEVVLTSSAASVTFSGLDAYSDYKHLQLRITAKNNFTGYPIQYGRFRLNAETSNSYSYHFLSGNGSSVTSTSQDTRSYIQMPALSGGTNANVFSSTVIDILDFSSTTKNTTTRAFGGAAPEGGASIMDFSSGAYYVNDAITSFTYYLGDPADFTYLVAGSRFSLYGSKG